MVAQPLWPHAQFGEIVGRSVAMRSLFEQIAQVADSDETVLIRGETGTGKDMVAKAIHEHSRRRGQPWVVVDCGAFDPALLGAQLFGYAKGAYTGAVRDTEGAFEHADGGTLFLDEIGEVPLEVQPMLLRALEARAIRRVGETEHRKVDVRVVAASWRDLREEVNRGTFREDLYYRLAVIPLHVPALRERKEDLPLLVARLLAERKDGRRAVPSEAVLEKLAARGWRGNVRELRNMVGAACVFGWERALEGEREVPGKARAAEDAGAGSAAESGAGSGASAAAGAGAGDGDDAWMTGGTFAEAKARWIERGERVYIKWLMEKHQHGVTRAAVAAGIDTSYVRKLVKKGRE